MNETQSDRRPGQPTLYRPEYCEMLIKHMSKGKALDSFAALIGVHRETLLNWCDAHQEFFDAKKTGLAASYKWWEDLGQELAEGTKQGNSAVWIFNMKNRFKWTDKTDIELQSKAADNSRYEALLSEFERLSKKKES